jgi:hypothetical protein
VRHGNEVPPVPQPIHVRSIFGLQGAAGFVKVVGIIGPGQDALFDETRIMAETKTDSLALRIEEAEIEKELRINEVG